MQDRATLWRPGAGLVVAGGRARPVSTGGHSLQADNGWWRVAVQVCANIRAQAGNYDTQHFRTSTGKFLHAFLHHALRYICEALFVLQTRYGNLDQSLEKQSGLRIASRGDPALLQRLVGLPPIAMIEKVDPVQVLSAGYQSAAVNFSSAAGCSP